MTNYSRQRRRRPVALLLLVPLVAVLVPEFYNYKNPAIGGMPFFYWYQLAWVAGVAVVAAIVYLATRSTR
jgi:Protein of unknown function (DUF3311)